MKNYADRGVMLSPRWLTLSLKYLHNSSLSTKPNSIIILLFIQNVSMFSLQANLLLVEAFFKTLAYFSARFQDIRRCFLADIPQKVDNIHLAICFVCLTFLSFIFSQKSAFRLWIAVNTIF